MIEDNLLDRVAVVDDTFDAEVEVALTFPVFAAPPVLENPRTVLLGTPLDQAAPGLDINKCAFGFGTVVADLDLLVELFDCGRPIEFDRVLALILIGDDVAEAVDLAFGKLWEVRFGSLGELDGPRLITEETYLCN